MVGVGQPPPPGRNIGMETIPVVAVVAVKARGGCAPMLLRSSIDEPGA